MRRPPHARRRHDGTGSLTFCARALALGKFRIGLGLAQLHMLALVAVVFVKQATTYTDCERRRMWASRPSGQLLGSSVVDVSITATSALGSLLMAVLPVVTVAAVLSNAAVLSSRWMRAWCRRSGACSWSEAQFA